MAESTVTVNDTVENEERVRKVAWNLLLAGLSPWEIHWIAPHELDMHDRFVSGEMEMSEVEQTIADAFPAS